jgi:hypothetical protein
MLKKILTITACTCMLASAANAQLTRAMQMYNSYQNSSGAGKRMWQRYYIGGGMTSMDLRVEHHFYGSESTERVIKQKLPSVTGYSATEGFYFPFSKPKTGGAFGIDVSTTANTYTYDVGTIVYDNNNQITETGVVYQAIIPIAFCYKSGGEVTLNKEHRNLFTFGAGFAPGYTISKVVAVDLQFSARKFIMAEYGFFAGIGWKVRGTVYFGDLPVVNTVGSDFSNADSYKGYDDGIVDMKATGKTNVCISLFMLPFSWDWERHKDYRY